MRIIEPVRTDADRARTAVDAIADLLDVPLLQDEPVGELADRCLLALREKLREADADAMVAAMYRLRRRREQDGS